MYMWTAMDPLLLHTHDISLEPPRGGSTVTPLD